MDGYGVELTAYMKTTEVDSKHQILYASDLEGSSSKLDAILNQLASINKSLDDIIILQKELLVLLKVNPTVIACLKSNFLKYE